ncbi:PIN domain-containing protein [Halonatronum saccharophilum]|uniref:PIN domain-containing protein n=1 Tax=Halonatronum saccharophilum TaxID=150060 RepID=UPI000487F727|nr:type II toxin-antitoxin system VapC family toxin [Halonatronum saccharophilum]
MKIVDANVILRYLLNDVEELSNQAAKIIDNNEVYILNEVLAEVVYVLQGVYNLDKEEVTQVLIEFSQLTTVSLEDKEIVTQALDKYSKIKLDFIDCLLFAYSKVRGDEIYTFDKKLNREINK